MDDINKMLEQSLSSMSEFRSDYRPLNMYALFRRDLDMPMGKLAAQSGHAFEQSYAKALIERPNITSQYKGSGNGTKICMWAKNLNHLVKAYEWLKGNGLPCAVIIDRGHVLPPHFDGKPIVTALGFGPVYRDEVEQLLKKYSMIA